MCDSDSQWIDFDGTGGQEAISCRHVLVDTDSVENADIVTIGRIQKRCPAKNP